MGNRKVKKIVENAYEKIKKRDFRFFLKSVFSKGFKKIEGTEFILWDDPESFPAVFTNALENHDRSITMGPRDFGKTHFAMAYALYKMITAEHRLQIYYISYKQPQAEGFIRKVGKPIAQNSPLISAFFGNSFSNAQTKMDVINPLGYQCIMEPKGLIGTIKGEHGLVIVDDPLKDESGGQIPNPTQVRKATNRFYEEVVPIIHSDYGECHIVGTAVAPEDLLHQQMNKPGWESNRIPAVKELEWNKNGDQIIGGISSWPKRWPSAKNFNSKLNDTTVSAFRKQYLTEADRDVDTYLSRGHLERCFGFDRTGDKFRDIKKQGLRLVGGHDLGKKVHPAHAIIFALDDSGEMWEWESKWFDGVPYKDQLDWWITKFNILPIFKAYYDDQGGQWEGFRERGDIPSNLEPKPTSYQLKQGRAAELETRVLEDTIHFQNDGRNFEQLMHVDQNLKCSATKQGHCDVFDSTCLAVNAARDIEKLRARFYNPEHQFDSNKKLRKQSKWDFS